MDIHKKVYERTIARLLSDHAERGIPEDTDLWPTIQERLARRAHPAEQFSASGHRDRPGLLSRLTPRRAQAAPSRREIRPHPYLRAAASMWGLLILAVISWVAISGLAQRQMQDQQDRETNKIVLATPTSMSIVDQSQETTPLFSIPVGEGGISYTGTSISGFFAAAPDGTLWVGSADARLLHYSTEGTLLGTIAIPAHPGYPQDMVTDGTNLWLLYTTKPENGSTVYKVALDGRKLAEYALPSYLGGYVTGLMLGERSEVFLRGIFYNVSPAVLTPSVPVPVPSVFPYTFPDPLWQLVDAQGNLAPQALEGYTRDGKLYFARPAYHNAQTNSGSIKAGNLGFPVVMSYPLLSIEMLGVEPDGSFHVLVVEVDEGRSAMINLYKTILHYAADGRLIEHARVPVMAVKLVAGPGGQFYVLMERPDLAQRTTALPNSVEVHRVNFYSADQPLPLLPTATLMPAPVQTILPDMGAPDLADLIRRSDAIAHVRFFGYNQEGQDVVLSMEVQQWLKRPEGMEASIAQLYVPADLWAAMPQTFKTNTDPPRESRYIMFLSKGPSLPTYDNTYSLAAGPEGTFYVNAGRIEGTVPGKYEGMPVDDFKRLITGEPTPVPVVKAQDTPTRLPNSPPVSLAREGDGFRLDVYEGNARFGSPPWLGSSHLLLEWASYSTTPGGVYTYSTYIVDTANGKLAALPGDLPEGELHVSISPDGNRAVMVWQGSVLRVALYDFRSGSLQTVADLDPGIPQWAGPEIGISSFKPGTEVFVYAVPTWAGNDTFALTLKMDTSVLGGYPPANLGKVLLVDTAQRRVRPLVDRGTVVAVFPDGGVLLRSGWIDGELQFFGPGNTPATTIAPSGPWTVGWSPSPDGKQVAWLEMAPPPGDWSKRLPNDCCSSDPAPTVKGIAVWNRATGEIRRFSTPDFAWPNPNVSWSQSARLVWSADGSALFYSTHPTQDSTNLYRLSLDGQAAPLVEMGFRVGLAVVAQGNDGSIYYLTDGFGCQNCAQLTRRYPDGNVEVVLPNSLSLEWRVDEQGRLVALKDGGVSITDLATGQSYRADFPGVHITRNELGWGNISMLAPISPDGQWAAYAGSQSDDIGIGPDGRSDRGRMVHIVRVK